MVGYSLTRYIPHCKCTAKGIVSTEEHWTNECQPTMCMHVNHSHMFTPVLQSGIDLSSFTSTVLIKNNRRKWNIVPLCMYAGIPINSARSKEKQIGKETQPNAGPVQKILSPPVVLPSFISRFVLVRYQIDSITTGSQKKNLVELSSFLLLISLNKKPLFTLNKKPSFS